MKKALLVFAAIAFVAGYFFFLAPNHDAASNASEGYAGLKAVWLKSGVDLDKQSLEEPSMAEGLSASAFSDLKSGISAVNGTSPGFSRLKEISLGLVDYLESKKDVRAKAAELNGFMDSKSEDVSVCTRLSDFEGLEYSYVVFLQNARAVSEQISQFNSAFPDESGKTVFAPDYISTDGAEQSFVVLHANFESLKEQCADENA